MLPSTMATAPQGRPLPAVRRDVPHGAVTARSAAALLCGHTFYPIGGGGARRHWAGCQWAARPARPRRRCEVGGDLWRRYD